MLVLVTTLLMAISILLSALVGLTPNFRRLMEDDFLRAAMNNALLYGIEYGQIAQRAGTLTKDVKVKDLGSLLTNSGARNYKLDISLKTQLAPDLPDLIKVTVEQKRSEISKPEQQKSER